MLQRSHVCAVVLLCNRRWVPLPEDEEDEAAAAAAAAASAYLPGSLETAGHGEHAVLACRTIACQASAGTYAVLAVLK